ncbi:MAG TPA: PssD/Cps14F family polysaccharide biosynthesis glycosyltransferase [Candidatus Hydrogenedentes bacterium]|nr:PssD/Cps14F family polysaccharide biosynthesis glycosyltransferase [Candidatus Hydrogenedentota bacterium]
MDTDIPHHSASTAGGGRVKVCLACSHGGHLTEMLQLQPAFDDCDTFFFCYEAETTRALPRAYLVPNMARSPVEFVKNLVRVWRIFRHEQPDLVVSTGAEIALPVLAIAKLRRTPVVYIECGAQVAHPSFTGRIMYWLADEFYVQWHELLHVYGRRARLRGSLIDEDDPVGADRSAERRMKVTLVHPALERRFSSDQPPLGLAYLASALERHGCEVRVIDAHAEKLCPTHVARLIEAQSPDMVGVSVTTPLLPAALDIARRLRAHHPAPILVAGGPHATVLPEDLLVAEAFDYVVRGEGEQTIIELIEARLANAGIEAVAGLSYRGEGGITHNAARTLMERIGELPHPDWSLFPTKQYSSLVRRNSHCLPIATSRGCPFACSFCYKGISGTRVRLRTPEDVVDEWAMLVERYGVHEIAVIDDAFTINPARVLKICALLVERGLNKTPWSTTNGIRVDNVTDELMVAMRGAGCYRVYFGIESGVQSVVDRLGKRITLEQVRAAVRAAKAAGLEVGGYFMFGNLGESAADMDATIRFAMALGIDYAQFTIATPYPGTRMFEDVQAQGTMLIHSWEELATFGRLTFTVGDVTPDLVARKFRKAIRRFYLRPQYLFRHVRGLFTWEGMWSRVSGAGVVVRLALFGGR